ncbi:putative transmembrane protein [Toxoplasma gondii TgCatPRC2]|uniref:Transmembrane protein n=3 Tax=Toxoplasma gondii TaxID=5811 RepID=S8GFD4_TOXGM|nr:hypothetical protein TGME49_244335 [Toxoplasma gondii ME49]EPT30555.1 hypothetical protein TGME49_244335 [Toxoplasma gondii ME49]KYK72002.1 putative transmembrane protein [Toxoplasma gondii TgCatPRC2]PIM02828.1 putative transmembrane protein [Toxoplasma gondii COUG]|eukprot:XP_018637547.1 hypothetical protein TGME49_244335 [Toxoplasma gondii ME49]
MWCQGTILHTFLTAASIWLLVVALALDEDGDKCRGKVQTTPKGYEEGNSVNDCTLSGADDDVASQVAESTKGECENNGPGFAPEAEYELILTTREALAEYGVHVSSEGGQIIHLAYRDRIAIPLVPQLLHDSKTEYHDRELIRSGFIRDRQEVVLVRSRSLEQAVVCGTCFRGGRYSVVRLKSTKTDDEGRHVYTFEKLIHPRWRPHALSFSIAADLVVIRGNRQPRVGSRILMTCVRSGDMPILFTDFLWSTPHLARYRPGPFKEEVTIQDVEAFAGSIPHTIVLKATLSSSKSSDRVVHHLTENSSFLFFGTVPAPSPSLSAFVLGSLKTDSRGTVERCDSAGPVFLSSSYWREIRNLAPTTHELVVRRRKFCRWIAFGLTVAAALFGWLAFAGYARNTLEQMFAMRQAGFRNTFSSWIRQRYGIDRHVVATFANSVDPHNIGLAAFRVYQNNSRNLTPGDPANDIREGSIALLMRAIGASGLAAVAAVAATVLPFKLARKAHRFLKAKRLIRRGRQQVANSAQTTVDGMRDSERSNEQRKGFIFAVVS